jgi:DegV family protein with EDD domain
LLSAIPERRLLKKVVAAIRKKGLIMITIVTDSTSYFKKDEAEQLGIRVIPNNYSINGQSFCEEFSDQNGDFESLLIGADESSTSHANLAAFLQCFEEELQKGNRVLCITISSRLSGAYSTAYAAAKQLEEDSANICVFDSKLTAGGLYLLIKEAKAKIMAEKETELQELLDILSLQRDKISITFSVDDMTPLRNSGRIGFVRQSIGTILNIKPILMCKDGAVVSDCVAHGDREIIKKLSDKIKEGTTKAIISYIGSNQLASDLYHVIKKMHPEVEVSLQKIGPVLGIHLGLKVIALSVV